LFDSSLLFQCNIQYALDPKSEAYCIIEVNARLSRSSALASKATGYPLAYVATKLCLGKDLVSIRNSITKVTTACFEPALDYCVVKMPRWDLGKFRMACNRLGSSMCSVGEVMAVGKTFEEAIQKAVRMVSGGVLEGLDGDEAMRLVPSDEKGDSSGPQQMDRVALEELLSIPTDRRLFAVQHALENGYSTAEVSRLSGVDQWFLSRLQIVADLKRHCLSLGTLNAVSAPVMRTLKISGFSDRQIARYCGSSELAVRGRRLEQGVRPFTKQIDTLAAEFPALTNYLYMTYNATESDFTAPLLTTAATDDKCSNEEGGVMVLGCGAYCIGSSVEFDWCAVSAIRQLRAMGDRTVVVNYNPETVSTDYDECDALYFEELTLERVLDIYQAECCRGVIVSVGGQIPNNLALPLHQQGVRVMGTCPKDIDVAEDRHKFSALLDKIKVTKPPALFAQTSQ
jgi:carbamoyl-phosphate synthase/aspartate carbamoyltransferase